MAPKSAPIAQLTSYIRNGPGSLNCDWNVLDWLSVLEVSGRNHDDVIKWKHFPHYWPVVRGIHRDRWIPRTILRKLFRILGMEPGNRTVPVCAGKDIVPLEHVIWMLVAKDITSCWKEEMWLRAIDIHVCSGPCFTRLPRGALLA